MIFIRQPEIDKYEGIIVTKDTELEYENENTKQAIKDLVLHSITTIESELVKSTYDTTIKLQDGDILIFEKEGRGYIKPVERFTTIDDAINDLQCIK